jgi:hypothetical protein
MQNEMPSAPLAPAPPSWRATLADAATQIGASGWIAIVLTFLGWFVLDTLRVEWGPLRQSVHFYEIASVIKSPARFFAGSESSFSTATVVFTLGCVLALLAPLTPYIWRNRLAWIGWMLPFALILVVGGWLYFKTSGDLFREYGVTDTIGNDIRHLANHLVHRAGAGVARKVTFGAGGYLALMSSAFLTLRGIRGFREPLPVARGIRR